MNKQIPIYFDTIILNSPIQEISCENSNAFRLQVGAFTKYKNRNGSYITDEYADLLIKSATRGNCPVVGFFDPEEQNWASHTGPKLANGYGYIESFVDWVPFQDTDGITREYAVFSVILFTDYFEEARKIKGQHQSMELDPLSIDGQWADFDGEDYFVYTKGNMLGFCIIGDHEPCFSVSSFFSKNDDTYKSQYEKFSSLLFNLKAQVEEAEKNNGGGEKTMENFENNPAIENEEVQIQESEVTEEETVVETVELEVAAEELEVEPVVETEPSEFEKLQNTYNDLQNSYDQLQNNFNEVQNHIAELEAFQSNANVEIEALHAENEKLQSTLAIYESQALAAEENRKNTLIEKYEKIINDAEEISVVKGSIKDLSYDELESKLAIIFAKQQMADSEENKVPLPEPPESQFALLMKKYRKN